MKPTWIIPQYFQEGYRAGAQGSKSVEAESLVAHANIVEDAIARANKPPEETEPIISKKTCLMAMTGLLLACAIVVGSAVLTSNLLKNRTPNIPTPVLVRNTIKYCTPLTSLDEAMPVRSLEDAAALGLTSLTGVPQPDQEWIEDPDHNQGYARRPSAPDPEFPIELEVKGPVQGCADETQMVAPTQMPTVIPVFTTGGG